MSKFKKIMAVSGLLIVLGGVFGVVYSVRKGWLVVSIKKETVKDPTSGAQISEAELDGKSANDLYKGGAELNKSGDYKDAQQFLEKAITKDNNDSNINVLRELAVADYNLRKYDDAIGIYEKILAISPNSASAYNELGNVYRDKGDRQAAKDSYQKAIAADASFVLAYNNLAMMYVYENDKDAAVSLLKDALAKDPNNEQFKAILKSIQG